MGSAKLVNQINLLFGTQVVLQFTAFLFQYLIQTTLGGFTMHHIQRILRRTLQNNYGWCDIAKRKGENNATTICDSKKFIAKNLVW